MFLNSYSVRIPGAKEDCGYVEMSHGQTYSLVLRNDNQYRCDARVTIDGKHIGTWRINGKESITIERPAHDTGKLTFYNAHTAEAIQAGLHGISSSTLGLVSVQFSPETQADYNAVLDSYVTSYLPPTTFSASPWHVSPDINADSKSNYSCSWSSGETESTVRTPPLIRGFNSGGTGLSGISSQRFSQVDNINYDYSRVTTINIRLVGKTNKSGPRPLTAFSTPVPPPIY